ncbi:PAS domain S-box-containing protein [Paenibacillus sp. UNCCL117]|uniref:MHYT domain-containing protein n=1 Tax=unclassified Paenibacillus TaxID=185978 RepID=UPI00088DD27C|nr:MULTISPECIES: MHYT domain-containing protein [unclassified Paenibacillus]SDD62353.1 PAS domain S-box-containing protein [Paenibacillus sp. cl123]SFW67631.1 PAS domain S-box-containing protein [Paenibacillus sp. UNCCL117]
MEYLHGTYSFPLVALSVLIAVVSSYAALTLNERVRFFQGRSRAVWMLLGSLTMGIGVWSTHIVGMLAFRLPFPVYYDPAYMGLALLLSVGASGGAIAVMADKSVSGVRLVLGGGLTGLAIACTHYIGVSGMRLPVQLSYNPYLVLLSVVIACGVSFGALYISVRQRSAGRHLSRKHKLMGALGLGAAIAGLHYTAMLGSHFSVAGELGNFELIRGRDEMRLVRWIGAAGLISMLLIAFSQFLDRRFALSVAEKNKQRYDLIFEHNPDMVCLFDLKGRLLRTNPAAERIMGYDAASFEGRSFAQFVSRRESYKIRSCFAKVLQGTPQTIEFSIRHRAGHDVILSTTIVPMIEAGKIIDIYTISKDITEQKKTERQLIQAKLEAERAARMKSEFLAIMSHEIRTPLNGVIGMSELLQETPLSEEQREYVGIIVKSGRSLMNVINEVLDFSKLEHDKVNLHQDPFYLQRMMEDTLQLFHPNIRQRRLEIRWQLDPDLPELLVGDEGRIRQILINLVGNAVKFTEEGEIAIRIRQKQREGERLQLEFTVKDTGVGIPQSYMPHLFQPFHQNDSSARKHGGTGLGLAICKRLVELMDGTIRVESKEGQGTKFTFTIYVKTAGDRLAVSV